MNTTDHGGGCCGIQHIWNLNSLREKGDNSLLGVINVLDDHGLAEVVATDYQLNHIKTLNQQLRANGFHLVSRVRNPNSDNYINVFHRYEDGDNELEESPYTIYLNNLKKEKEEQAVK